MRCLEKNTLFSAVLYCEPYSSMPEFFPWAASVSTFCLSYSQIKSSHIIAEQLLVVVTCTYHILSHHKSNMKYKTKQIISYIDRFASSLTDKQIGVHVLVVPKDLCLVVAGSALQAQGERVWDCRGVTVCALKVLGVFDTKQKMTHGFGAKDRSQRGTTRLQLGFCFPFGRLEGNSHWHPGVH